MRNELNIDNFVTHTFKGLGEVNKSIEALHSGDCLRAVVQINEYKLASDRLQFKQISNVKVKGGYLKQIQHLSKCNHCEMTFSIYIPDQAKRCDPPPSVLYFLSGLGCTDEDARTKAGIYEHASRYNMAVVFPDTSARGVDIEGQDDDKDFGSGAGFYVNAKTYKWKKHFKMYDYITKELPHVISLLFTVNSSSTAISGHSMGGHGALSLHLRNPGKY